MEPHKPVYLDLTVADIVRREETVTTQDRRKMRSDTTLILSVSITANLEPTLHSPPRNQIPPVRWRIVNKPVDTAILTRSSSLVQERGGRGG